MTKLSGVVRMLKKEHDRLTKEVSAIAAALGFWHDIRKAERNSGQYIGGRQGKDRGCPESTMGKGEGKERQT